MLASSVTSVCLTESGSLHFVAFDSSLCHVGYLTYISLGAAMMFMGSACHPVIIYVCRLLCLQIELCVHVLRNSKCYARFRSILLAYRV